MAGDAATLAALAELREHDLAVIRSALGADNSAPSMTVYEAGGVGPERCGLPSGGLALTSPDGPTLYPYLVPLAVLDCVLVTMPGDPARIGGVLHGTDCEVSRAVAEARHRRDCSPCIPSCARVAAGGSFRTFAADEMARRAREEPR